MLPFKELEEERDAAEHVKRETRIIVVLGNPPYNAFAGISPAEEQGLVEPYKEGLVKDWKIKKFNLDDLYVRFFRLAERSIAEKAGIGIVSFISNHSWISDPSFVVLRKHLLQSFDKFWIENMHGNRKISEYAPDGRTSETIFAIPGFSAGIQQGVSISLWVKSGKKVERKEVLFRDDLDDARATERRAHLLASLDEKQFVSRYRLALPNQTNRYSFRPQVITPQYMSWPSVESLCEFLPTLGILENRQEDLISIDKPPLEKRTKVYFDPKIDWETLRALVGILTKDFARFDAKKTREKALKTESYTDEAIRPLLIRPMDDRWCYYTGLRPIWNEPRPAYVEQLWSENATIVTRRKGVASPEGVPFFFTRSIGYQHALHTDAYYIPLQLREGIKHKSPVGQSNFLHKLADGEPQTVENLSQTARTYLSQLDESKSRKTPARKEGDLWMHVLAIGYSPAYLKENADGIRQDWPRIPLPNCMKCFESSTELGRQIASLLDTGSSIAGVTSGSPRPEYKFLGATVRAGGGSLNESELALTAGWGHAGKGGVTMPGKGKLVERDYSPSERKTIFEGAKALGLTEKQVFAHLGSKTCDVYLNGVAYWSNIPSRVWDYTIGGYQVIKKWLSYREEPLLGRALTKDEVRYVQEMARRIAAILLLEPALDANYKAVKENAFPWPPKP